MRIGCDLDGVIIDHRGHQSLLLREIGFDIPRQELYKDKIKKLLTPGQYKEFQNKLYGEMSLRANAVLGARKALLKLKADGHEVRIISRRNAGASFARQWLIEHGFSKVFSPDTIHFVKSDMGKEVLCQKLHVELYVDDLPGVLEILKTPAHKILLSHRPQQHPAATFTTNNWPDIVGHIKTLG